MSSSGLDDVVGKWVEFSIGVASRAGRIIVATSDKDGNVHLFIKAGSTGDVYRKPLEEVNFTGG